MGPGRNQITPGRTVLSIYLIIIPPGLYTFTHFNSELQVPSKLIKTVLTSTLGIVLYHATATEGSLIYK